MYVRLRYCSIAHTTQHWLWKENFIMHDQRKVKEELDAAACRFQEEKIARFRALYDELLRYRNAGNLSREEMLPLLDVLLEISPEQYTFFGYRRKIFLASWSAIDDDEQRRSQVSSDLDQELVLNTKVIQKDFKVYSAFVHRRWIFGLIVDAPKRNALLQTELKKCEALLKLDERNFHVWGYRRWVTRELRAANLFGDEQEWSFTDGKINQNFSNYSAWHNRALMVESFKGTSAEIDSLCLRELELATKAFYCDPRDQSAWFYAAFILRHLARCGTPASHTCAVVSIANACDELRRAVEDEDAEAASLHGSTEADSAVITGVNYAVWMQWTLIAFHPKALSETATLSANEVLSKLGLNDCLRRGMYASLIEQMSVN